MIYNYHISIIGFGEVGSTVASVLNARLRGVFFNIIDPSEHISGRILDFSHACSVRNNEISINDQELLSQADFVIYAAGSCNPKGTSRYTVAQENKNLVCELFNSLVLKPNCLIVAITNPVDLVSRWIFECLNRSNLVIGTGTSLETYRLNYLVSQFENCSVSDVNTMVLGEHGAMMVPVESHSYVSGKPIHQLYHQKELSGFYQEVIHAADQIRETEKASKFGVASCVEKIILSFVGEQEHIFPVSVLINSYYKKLTGCEDDIFISLPCVFKNNEIEVLPLDDLTEQEIASLQETAKHLSKEFTNLV